MPFCTAVRPALVTVPVMVSVLVGVTTVGVREVRAMARVEVLPGVGAPGPLDVGPVGAVDGAGTVGLLARAAVPPTSVRARLAIRGTASR
jgi:hypothetical protein